MIDFKVETILLSNGAFANYTAQKRAEGVDLVHYKISNINPSEEALIMLLASSNLQVNETESLKRIFK
jgi:hypothetical protein